MTSSHPNFSAEKVFKLIQDKNYKWVDYRFCDTKGKEQHVSIPCSAFKTPADISESRFIDGSSIAGWREIHQSDMKLVPCDENPVEDIFAEQPTLIIRCNVAYPDKTPYNRCPRTIAERAEQYLKDSGVADTAYFGPEPEFYVFDGISFHSSMESSFYEIESAEGAWENANNEEGNPGHRPGIKGGYFPVAPVDQLSDLRAAMCDSIERMGMETELHHHEVGTGGQCEIGIVFNTLVQKADELLKTKYAILNTAALWDKTATFMPKPIEGDNGSGMHVHMSLFANGENLFKGDKNCNLSQEALWFIGGIFKHAHAVNAFTNATVNSYRRLIPGFEAPTYMAYSAVNRSVAVRIPAVSTEKARRIEVRFPDNSSNPYLAFTALLMAGLDGIKNQIDPGEDCPRNLYAVSRKEAADIPEVASSLKQALEALDKDRDFLKVGGVMDDDAIDAYIDLKHAEFDYINSGIHPKEFELYYSL